MHIPIYVVCIELHTIYTELIAATTEPKRPLILEPRRQRRSHQRRELTAPRRRSNSSTMLFLLVAIAASTETIRTCTGLVQHHEPGIMHEICMRETLNASCGDSGSGLERRSQVIFIRSARYGRMRIGRCVRKGYDYLGCAVDVRSYMDTRCSGRHSCTMRVPDDVIFEMQPCPTDLTSYLDITYDCIDVQAADASSCRPGARGAQGGPPNSSSRQHSSIAINRDQGLPSFGSAAATAMTAVIANDASGYLASVVSADDSSGLLGTAACPWLIAALPGQRINVTFFNFVGSSNAVGNSRLSGGYSGYGPGPSRADVCLEVAAVVELTEPGSTGPVSGRKPIMACGGDPRESHVLLSQSHRILVEMHNPKMIHSVGTFVLHYAATGCPDVPYTSMAGNAVTGAGWMRRDADTTTIGCNSTSETWYLTCKNGRWIGDVVNCSSTTGALWRQMFRKEDSFQYGVLLMVILGIAVGVVIGALLLCLIAKFTRRRACNVQVELTGTYQPQTEYQGVLRDCATTLPQLHDSPPPHHHHHHQTSIPVTPLSSTFLHDALQSWPPPPPISVGTGPGGGCLYGRCQRGGFPPIENRSTSVVVRHAAGDRFPLQPPAFGRQGDIDMPVTSSSAAIQTSSFKIAPSSCATSVGLRHDALTASFTNLL